jgi:hypothetical protein
MDQMLTQLRKNLADIYVFVNGSSRGSANELVACYDDETEVEKGHQYLQNAVPCQASRGWRARSAHCPLRGKRVQTARSTNAAHEAALVLRGAAWCRLRKESMTNRITISPSPMNAGIEIVDGLCIKRHVPYNATSVTLQFSPNITHHEPEQSQPGAEIRQLSGIEANDETVSHLFDMDGVKIHSVTALGVEYKVELLNIDTSGQFPSYDLSVSRT